VFVAGAVLYQHQRQVEIQNARLRAMMMGEGSTPVPQDPTSPQPQTDAQRSAEAPPPDGNAIREAAKNPPHSASRETPMSEADIHKLTAEGDRVIRESEKAIADYEAKKAQRNASRPLEPPSGTWRDPNTGLVWLTRDNGEAAIESKDAARRYCESVTTGDRLGWRLPTTPELKDAFTSNQMYLYGTLRSHRHFEMLWTSSSTDGVVPVGSPEEVGGIDLQNMRNFLHAVCVHD